MAEFFIPIKNYVKNKYFKLLEFIDSFNAMRKFLNNTTLTIYDNKTGEELNLDEFGLEFNTNFNQNVYFLITPKKTLIEDLMLDKTIFIQIGDNTRFLFVD